MIGTSMFNSLAYSLISLYTNGLTLKETYLPLNSLVNSFDNSFELEPVTKTELSYSLSVLTASAHLSITCTSSKKI